MACLTDSVVCASIRHSQASLRFLPVFPHQIVTIIGIVNPLGQPAFLDTAINVAKDGVLLLQSIRLTAPANAESGGTIVTSYAICGDKILSEGEECDDGPLGNSAEKADSCRPINCTKASCGDGVTDSGEQCDEGPSGGLNCTKECQAICPVLPNLTEATFAVDCTARNYADSVNYCKAQGTQIASIHNNKDNNVVVNLVKQVGCTAYLGAESNGKGTWSWNDGTKWDFVPTKNDGMQGKSETKAAMNKDDSAWHDWGTGSK